MAVQHSSLSVLVADDFSNFRSTVNGMLHGLGIDKVALVSNGEEVLDRCEKRRYDIILCDYDLGEGRNGQHVLEELRHRKLIDWRNIFIMVSAEASRNIVMSAYDCEPDDYLMKPINTKTLQRRMDRLLLLRDKLKSVRVALDKGDEQYATDTLIDMSLAEDRYASFAQKMLGELFISQGELSKAEKLYTKTLEVRQLEWARLGLAKVKHKMGEFELAGKWLNRIVDDNPLFLPAYDVLADNWEEQGETQESQNTIQKAVEVSPMSILRQKRLAGIAQINGDTLTALDAMKKMVRLGRFSCHGSVDDHFAFVRAVTLAKNDNVDLPQDMLDDFFDEASNMLANAVAEYDLSEEQKAELDKLKQDMDIVASGGSISVVTAAEKGVVGAESAEEQLDESLDETLEYDLDQVDVLLAQGNDEQADALLNSLKEIYAENEAALEKLDRFLEEPVSESNRELVSEVNREGIGLYSQGRYEDALSCFDKAKKLFPKHVGIQLNIAQCLIGKLKEQPENATIYQQCEEALAVVDDLIESDHDQHGRFAKLKRLAATTYSSNGQAVSHTSPKNNKSSEHKYG